MNWSECQNKVLPFVFLIETPDGSGSGVFYAYNRDKSMIAIATAAHVIEHAEDWKLPIKLRQHTTGKSRFLKDSERVVFLDRRRDSASIIIANDGFDLPETPLSMMAADKYMPIGSEVGWLGYPGIAQPHLCFFTGPISSFIQGEDSYLIDGVAINGVSGGPVFACLQEDNPKLLGTVSAYMLNRVRGEALPGLLRSQDLTSFHEAIKTITSVDDAREKKAKEEAEAKEKQQQLENSPPARTTPDTL
jgi:hypothetical protein